MIRDTILASGLFDPEFYLLRYPEIRQYGRGPLAHFCEYGIREHRDPGPNFDTSAFLKRFPEAGKLAVPPLLHVLGSEHITEPSRWLARDAESLRYLLERSGLFNREWYARRYPDVLRAQLDPMEHLIEYGIPEGRDPGPLFETAFYVETYPAFHALDLPPLEHFLRIGRAAGHAGNSGPTYERWAARFNDLTETDAARIAADAVANPVPPVAWIHCPDGTDEAAIRGDAAAQLGVAVRLLTGPDARSALDGLADGTLLILTGGGARLHPHATYVLANAVARFGMAAAYSDHDVRDSEMHRSAVFKPAMSPDFMARLPYAGPVVAVMLTAESRKHVRDAIALAAGDPSRAWAGLLLTMPAVRVIRIPFPLYVLPGTAVAAHDEAPIYEPVGEAGSVTTPARTAATAWPTVALVIPTRDRHELLRACVDSIFEQTTYPRDRMEVVVVDNGSSDGDSLAYLATLAERPGCTVVASPGPFNFSKICNDGAAAAGSDVLVFLNNDTTVLQADWLEKLVGNAVRPEIGIVGAQLLYPDGTVQHGGVVLGIQGVGGHRLSGVAAEKAAYRDVTREMVAVTGACLAIRRAVFEQFDGLDERLGVAFNDTLLCIRAHEAGYRNLYLAEPLLTHHESKSRGFDDTRQKLARNRREAIYVRERHGDVFRDDPSYSPNLSLQEVGFLAVPPRVVRPWRRSPPGIKRILILSSVHGLGHGVAAVVAQQAEFLLKRGWEVIIGGPETPRDRAYGGCERVALRTPIEAAAFAVKAGLDCIVAHTPPFFSITRFVGRRPLVYMFDHGEPPPDLFVDRIAREDIDWEKRFVAPLARRIFTISRAIQDQQFRRDTIVLRNGNSHLSTWSHEWERKRAALRDRFGFTGRFVVLNVCRFGEEERRYKGVDAMIDLLSEVPFLVPELADKALFALAGRGDTADVAYVEAGGLTAFANVSDTEMAELYAASDLYLSLPQWEGYNLGIGQALAMGLPVVASDIPAHREFGIDTGGTSARLCALIRAHYEAWDETATRRAGRIEPWDGPLARMADILEADCAEENDGPWY